MKVKRCDRCGLRRPVRRFSPRSGRELCKTCCREALASRLYKNQRYSNGTTSRDLAGHLLALSASMKSRETLDEIASHCDARAHHIALARRALAESVDAGNWREVRAEAEAKLRTDWRAA